MRINNETYKGNNEISIGAYRFGRVANFPYVGSVMHRNSKMTEETSKVLRKEIGLIISTEV
jgi:hypothetical protein